MANGKTSLQDIIDGCDNLVDRFYNDTRSPHASNRAGLAPIPAECSNWRDEQRAWREAVLLFDQTHHMSETFISGPDSIKFLSDFGVNSFAKFPELRAKQYTACNHQGQIIGESILQNLGNGTYELISGTYLQNWLEYNAEIGNYDIELVRDLNTSDNPGGPEGRTFFRYELDGPLAGQTFNDAVEGDTPDMRYFSMAKVKIVGCDVYVLRHSVAGHKGVELSGRLVDGPKVYQRLLEVGEKYGIVRAGLKTYFSTGGEVGWLGHPCPAVYTSEKLTEYRKWLPATSWEAHTELGGSFRSPNIEDYYFTPFDQDMAKLMKFDHDFVGREALEKMAAEGGHRKKVTLAWNDEDVADIYASLMHSPNNPYKFMELPKVSYALHQFDEVRNSKGDLVGVSTYMAYTVNEGKFLSIAFVDEEHAEVGTDLTVTWGEPDGGSRKPQVEKHQQKVVRAKVGPTPYPQMVRDLKNIPLFEKVGA